MKGSGGQGGHVNQSVRVQEAHSRNAALEAIERERERERDRENDRERESTTKSWKT